MNKKRLFMLFVIGVVVATMMVVAVGSSSQALAKKKGKGYGGKK